MALTFKRPEVSPATKKAHEDLNKRLEDTGNKWDELLKRVQQEIEIHVPNKGR